MKKKLAFFFTALVLFYTNVTDADLLDVEVVPNNLLKATTLDFSNKNTANNMPTSTLFTVVGMVPDGFAVESLRIKKEGELAFPYRITAIPMVNENDVCSSLTLIVEEDFERKYEGKLTDFVLLSNVEENSNSNNSGSYEDLVFYLKLENPTNEQKAKSCSFNLAFQTNLEESGFTDEELVLNQVSLGVW